MNEMLGLILVMIAYALLIRWNFIPRPRKDGELHHDEVGHGEFIELEIQYRGCPSCYLLVAVTGNEGIFCPHCKEQGIYVVTNPVQSDEFEMYCQKQRMLGEI